VDDFDFEKESITWRPELDKKAPEVGGADAQDSQSGPAQVPG